MDSSLLLPIVVGAVSVAATLLWQHWCQRSARAASEAAAASAARAAAAAAASSPPVFPFTQIGTVSSVFRRKYGAPRQGSVIPSARGIITMHPSVPRESLEGLEEYSHIWIMFIFSANTNKRFRPRIEPPRLGGRKVGVYGTRTPHRINPLGMSAVRLERVDLARRQIHVSGLDIIDNTPVVDIKPYHPADCMQGFTQPAWMDSKEEYPFTVTFSEQVRAHLTELVRGKKLRFYTTLDEILEAIRESASLDPRPVYLRKRKSKSEVYGYDLDRLNVQHTIDEDTKMVHIVDVTLYPDDNKGRVEGGKIVVDE